MGQSSWSLSLIVNMADTIAASDDVVSRMVGGEMVLLDLASGLYFGLNKVGSRVWELLEEAPHSGTQLCDVIEAEFDAERVDIERDVLALLGDLEERKLVVNASTPA